MNEDASVEASPRLRLLDRVVKVEWAGFVKGFTKVAVKVATGQWVDAAAEAPDIFASIGLKTTPEDLAWTLVVRSFSRAMGILLKEYAQSRAIESSIIGPASEHALSEGAFSFTFSSSFFKDPSRGPVASQLEAIALNVFTSLSIPTSDAQNLSNRLSSNLATAFHDEWRSNPNLYAPLAEALDSPFKAAAENQVEWARYRAYLASFAAERIFEETFSLSEIYIDLRAYIVEKVNVQGNELGSFEFARRDINYVVMVRDEIKQWLNKRDKDFSIRLISGDPGSGKSATAKMIAAELSRQNDCLPLFIPLYQVDFGNGLTAGVGSYLSETFQFKENPLRKPDHVCPIILIFDGLDELQLQGKASQEVASQFVRDLVRLIDNANVSDCAIQAIVTGRALAVQAAEDFFHQERQTLHLLPYVIPSSGPTVFSNDSLHQFVDKQHLLSEDQRQKWWLRYTQLSGKSFSVIPLELTRGELGELTSQPLLNYLVAVAYSGGLELDEHTNINSVYSNLLSAVFQRSWARHPHPSVRGIDFKDFLRLLEEVALAVWHGAGRTTTLREVEDHCSQSKIGNLLSSFQEGISAGISTLLLAFYFRQKGRRDSGDKTFEFTHKSFAEYLISRRVVRAVRQIAHQMTVHLSDHDSGWDIDEALYRWLTICGPSAMDAYLLEFIRREMRLMGSNEALVLQKALQHLYGAMLKAGWPMARFNHLRFLDHQRWARNAEEAILACINACSLVSDELIEINWPFLHSFGEALKRLQGQRIGPGNALIMDCLSNMNLTSARLDMADLYGANLRNTNLSGARLNFATLQMANLQNTNLRRAQLLEVSIDVDDLTTLNLSSEDISKIRSQVNRRLLSSGKSKKKKPSQAAS